jgi:predicted dehydrogenase
MKKLTTIFYSILIVLTSCNVSNDIQNPVRLITLDPGHFHAALVQKSMYPDVDSTVYVYAPAGQDLKFHLDRIKGYNTRAENPTHWNEQIYTGTDFFEKLIAEKKGNVVVLSGNNQKKTDYILQSLQNGLNVLADKPMVIDATGFEKLKQAFEVAEKNKLLLYDIMTERFEITTVLQRELSMLPEIFGTLEKGTPENPAITKESVHHFYKFVSGAVLTRPAWFLDANQQGEGIVDVTTHLVDLVQWECFPEQVIDYKKDIEVYNAKRWATNITPSQFKDLTKQDSFPSFLKENITDTVLKVFCNGEINYILKGVHAKTSVIWNFKAPDGTGDTHYSIMRGTKANLIIHQGADQKFKPSLYIEPLSNTADTEKEIQKAFEKISLQYKGISLKKNEAGWEVIIPESFKEGHESHFARVTEKYLDYLLHHNMPPWEVPNMLAKYYTTTMAKKLAAQK